MITMPNLLKLAAVMALVALGVPLLNAQNASSLQDIGGASWKELPAITIYPAKEVVTLDPDRPTAKAVAVVDDRILATGDLEALKERAGDQEFRIDQTFADKVIVPGFIAQHDHPVLTALTMASEVLAIEDWALPDRTIPAVKDKADFMKRLSAAEEKLEDPDEPLVSWGYHPSFFGELTREPLNEISKTRPVVVWARSCHEIILNDAGLKAAGIDEEMVEGWSESQREQSNFEEGRFWEQGFFAALATDLATMIATPEKLQTGLEIARDYMHAKGITFGNEPGGILVKPVQDGAQEQDEQRHGQQFPAIFRDELRRVRACQQVDQPTHVGNQPDLHDRHDDRHDRSDQEEPLEGLRIVPQERPQLSGRAVLFGIVRVGIDQVFKETKHQTSLEMVLLGADIARWLQEDHDGRGSKGCAHAQSEHRPRTGGSQQQGEKRACEAPEQADEEVDAGKGGGKALCVPGRGQADAVACCGGQRDGPDLGVHPLEQDRLPEGKGAFPRLAARQVARPHQGVGHPQDPARRDELQGEGQCGLRQEQRAYAKPHQRRDDTDTDRHAEHMRQRRAKAEARARGGQKDHVGAG